MPILDEYHRAGAALAIKYPERALALAPLLNIVAVHATLVDAPPLASPVGADPSDDMFLAAAVAVDARLIVSGDRHLLEVSGWHDINVLTQRVFVDQYLRT